MSQDCAEHALIALGANLGFGGQSPEETIANAFKALERRDVQIVRSSRLYRTPCFPNGAGPDYINAAACVTWRQGRTAQDLLQVLHSIEADYGRDRQRRWAGRTLDMDLLAVGDSILPDRETFAHWRDLTFRDQLRMAPEQLVLPHPRLQDRAFVLVPLADVAPDWVHPVLGLSVVQMLAMRPAEEIAAVIGLPAVWD